MPSSNERILKSGHPYPALLVSPVCLCRTKYFSLWCKHSLKKLSQASEVTFRIAHFMYCHENIFFACSILPQCFWRPLSHTTAAFNKLYSILNFYRFVAWLATGGIYVKWVISLSLLPWFKRTKNVLRSKEERLQARY